jgi:hypothetical protein
MVRVFGIFHPPCGLSGLGFLLCCNGASPLYLLLSRNGQPPDLFAPQAGQPHRPVPDANAVASGAMPLPTDRVRGWIDARDWVAKNASPHRTVAKSNLAAQPRNSRSDQSGSVAGRCIHPGNSAVSLVQNPDGTGAHCEEPRLRSHRSFAHDLVSRGFHPHQRTACVGGDPKRAL